MKEFDYDLDYKTLDFTDDETRKLYRIGRGEQGVLLVRPYTEEICKHWRFKNVPTATQSSHKIYEMFCNYRRQKDFIGMDMARKFLEMGFTRARRYANHKTGRKYSVSKEILPQENDALTSEKAQAAQIFKKVRDLAAYDPKYQEMRKQWRKSE
jgi:hypothetical protein|tara:strand:- start:915 stop:1376 length:462 start_codon:yes stop_codon:yes gene_type:complete